MRMLIETVSDEPGEIEIKDLIVEFRMVICVSETVKEDEGEVYKAIAFKVGLPVNESYLTPISRFI